MANNLFYRFVVEVAYAMTKLQGLQITLLGKEHIPDTGGGVVVQNHTGYMDFVFGGYIPREKKRLVRYMTKSTVFDKPVVGSMMRAMAHIPVDRINGEQSFNLAVEAAKSGELVGIFPESTISRSFEIKDMRTGAVRIANAADVPLIPMVMFGTHRLMTKGGKRNMGRSKIPVYIKVLEPWRPDPNADPEAETANLREQMKAGLAELWELHQKEHGPFPEGEFWVPARFGGGAPTLEQTAVEDKKIADERREVRRVTERFKELAEKVATVSKEIAAGKFKRAGQAEEAEVPDEGAARQFADWLRVNFEELARVTPAGVKEGGEKIAKAKDKLQENSAELSARLTRSGAEFYEGSRLEEALTSLAVDSRRLLAQISRRNSPVVEEPPELVSLDPVSALSATKDGDVAERDREAIRSLAAMGVPVVFTSNAGPEELHGYADVLGITPTVIAYGGVLTEEPGGEAKVAATWPEELTDEAEAVVSSSPAADSIQWHRGSDGLVLAGEIPVKREHARATRSLEEELSLTVGDAARITRDGDRLYLLPAGTGKDMALKAIAGRYGADPEKVMTFVSAHDDLPLVSAFGRPVALHHAHHSVIRATPTVTGGADEADEAGVADVIELVLP